MKKKLTSKMSLSRETIVQLDLATDDLHYVVGGGYTTCGGGGICAIPCFCPKTYTCPI